MKRFFLTLSCVLCTVGLFQSAEAAVTFEVFLEVDGDEGLDTNIVQEPGTVLAANLIFRETVTDGTIPVTPDGISAIGVDIRANGADGMFTDVTTSPTLFIGGTQRDDDTFFGGTILPPGVLPDEVTTGVFDSLIGTVNLTTPTIGATTFSLSDPQPAMTVSNFNIFGDISADGGIPDGDIIFRSVTLTSTVAVPEPTSMAAMALLGGTAMIRRRRKKAATAKV